MKHNPLVSRLAARCTLGSDLVGAAIFAASFSRLSEMSSLKRAVTRTERLNRSKSNDVLCLCVNPFFRRSLFLWLLVLRYSHHRYLWIMPPSVESGPGWSPVWWNRGNVHRVYPLSTDDAKQPPVFVPQQPLLFSWRSFLLPRRFFLRTVSEHNLHRRVRECTAQNRRGAFADPCFLLW
jgi:hypothetical protein